MLQPEGRRLYAVMFVASLMAEVYGTWIGNWVWHRDVPYLGLNSANPPLAAGAFYCALDVLVGLTTRGLRSANHRFGHDVGVMRRAGLTSVPDA